MAVDKQIIKDVLNDWQNGHTHGEILEKYNLPRSQEFAITFYYKKLDIDQISQKIGVIKPGMNSREIKRIMEA